jgi:hypothetical protein
MGRYRGVLVQYWMEGLGQGGFMATTGSIFDRQQQRRWGETKRERIEEPKVW